MASSEWQALSIFTVILFLDVIFAVVVLMSASPAAAAAAADPLVGSNTISGLQQ